MQSEWAIDVDALISRLEDEYDTSGLKSTIEHYTWWSEAKSAGAALPSNTLLWHYNPIHFVEHVFTQKNTLNVPYKEDHIPKTTKNNRRPQTKISPDYLTIHSTGMRNPLQRMNEAG